MTSAAIEKMLINLGYNSALVYRMTDAELQKADEIYDKIDLDNYMDRMNRKYRVC